MPEGNQIYVYGAGRFSNMLLKYLSENGGLKDRIKSIVVTDKQNAPDQIEGIRVIQFDESDINDDSTVMVATFEKYNFSIREKLLETGAKMVFFSNDVFYQLQEKG